MNKVKNINWIIKYRLDIFFSIIIITGPFLLFSHLLFDDNSDIFYLFGSRIIHDFGNNQNLVWQFLSCILALTLLLIIFVTTKNRWKYFLIPLITLLVSRLLFFTNITRNFGDSYLTFEGITFIFCIVLAIIKIDLYYFSNYRNKALLVSIFSIVKKENEFGFKLQDLKRVKYRLDKKNKTNIKNYLARIYYLQSIMANHLNSSKETDFKKLVNTSKRYEIVIITILIFNTLLWFVPDLIPIGIHSLEYGWFAIDDNGFPDLFYFVWWVINKLIIIIPLVIWYSTNLYWWKYAMLVPMLMYLYQFWEAFQDVESLDAIGNVNTFPILIITIIGITLLSKYVRRRCNFMHYYDYLTSEINEIICQFSKNELHKEFYKIINENTKSSISDQDQLLKIRNNKLNEIKELLIKQLEVNL